MRFLYFPTTIRVAYNFPLPYLLHFFDKKQQQMKSEKVLQF